MKFKVGDRVIYQESDMFNGAIFKNRVGQEAEVTKSQKSFPWYEIRFYDGYAVVAHENELRAI